MEIINPLKKTNSRITQSDRFQDNHNNPAIRYNHRAITFEDNCSLVFNQNDDTIININGNANTVIIDENEDNRKISRKQPIYIWQRNRLWSVSNFFENDICDFVEVTGRKKSRRENERMPSGKAR